MGSLIEELRRREAAARAGADRLRTRIEELSEDLARAEEQASRPAIAREEVARVLEEPAVTEPPAGQNGRPAGKPRPALPIGAVTVPPWQEGRALDIEERLGNQAGMAASYHQLGILAQDRGDYDEAARQYQRSLDINERLGNQAGMASSYSQLGILDSDRHAPATAVIAWHVKALAIRLRLGVPQAVIDLRRLAACRRELGAEPFTGLLAQAAGDTELADTITSLLDQVDATDDGTARLAADQRLSSGSMRADRRAVQLPRATVFPAHGEALSVLVERLAARSSPMRPLTVPQRGTCSLVVPNTCPSSLRPHAARPVCSGQQSGSLH